MNSGEDGLFICFHPGGADLFSLSLPGCYCFHAPGFLSTRLLSNFNLKLILPFPHPWFHLFFCQQPQILSTANLFLLTQCFAHGLGFLSVFFFFSAADSSYPCRESSACFSHVLFPAFPRFIFFVSVSLLSHTYHVAIVVPGMIFAVPSLLVCR